MTTLLFGLFVNMCGFDSGCDYDIISKRPLTYSECQEYSRRISIERPNYEFRCFELEELEIINLDQ